MNFGLAIVTNGDFTAYVCNSASTVGAAVWGGACGIAVLDGGRRRPKRSAGFGGFCFPFSQWEVPLGRPAVSSCGTLSHQQRSVGRSKIPRTVSDP